MFNSCSLTSKELTLMSPGTIQRQLVECHDQKVSHILCTRGCILDVLECGGQIMDIIRKDATLQLPRHISFNAVTCR